MRISRLELESFRSYRKKTLYFEDLSVIVAPNAKGKTNILEAIYLLSYGDSFRARKIEEMVKWEEELGRVTGIVESGIGESAEVIALTVTLTRGVLMGKRTQKRRFLIDGTPRTKGRFVKHLSVVLFRPEDLRLVEGSPSRRRSYLDEALILSSYEYGRALRAYEQALRRRNRILDLIRDGKASRNQLAFWDQTMIKNGNILTNGRRELIEYMNGLRVAFGKYRIEYDSSTISETRLAKYAKEEVAAGYTLVGPHKDDFLVYGRDRKVEKNLMIYGSRGEQRLGVLFLKLGMLEYIEDSMSLKPVLLLDDIFSELDEVHRQEVLKMTHDRQTIITTADEYILDEFLGREVQVIRI